MAKGIDIYNLENKSLEVYGTNYDSLTKAQQMKIKKLVEKEHKLSKSLMEQYLWWLKKIS